ncbi:MAG: DUF302 domain-containing protein [Thiogranum sp.]|jgi:uncharacterized protein (DUF302 family)|nr:DUF302 domain-containing protein [Thiogranum sp.]
MKQLFIALLLTVCGTVSAQDLYMVRSSLAFPETMSLLQQTIKAEGYEVSRVQRVDIGLTKSGFKTDKYRIVFFGKLDDVRAVSDQYPELIPYLPLKIAIFAEGDETLLLSSSFQHLRPFYKSPTLRERFDRWDADINKIMERVRNAD